VKVTLHVQYPDDYPDVLPEMSLACTEGELNDAESKELLKDLKLMVSPHVNYTRSPKAYDHNDRERKTLEWQ